MYVWIVRTGWGVMAPFFKMTKPTTSEIEAEFNIYGERRHHHDWEIAGPFDVWVMNMLESINYDLLREQKHALLEVMTMPFTEEAKEKLDGIIGLIDAVQDEMAKYLGEARVFGPDSEGRPQFVTPEKDKRPARKLNIQR